MPLHFRPTRSGITLAVRYSPGKALPSGATFARNLEAAYLTAGGILTFAAPNVIRDAHYVGGVRTLLLEPASTNLCPYSFPGDETAGRWTNFLMLSQGTFLGPDGGANSAFRTHGNTPNTDSAHYIPFALAAGVYRVSLWLRIAADGPTARRLALGAGATIYSADIPTMPNWTRTGVNINTGAAAVTNGGFANPSYGNGLSADHYGFQVEVQPVETSHIRTNGAAVTRPIDDLRFDRGGTLYEKYYDDANVLQDSVRAYVANTTIAPARPRRYVSLKLALGNYSLAQMRNA